MPPRNVGRTNTVRALSKGHSNIPGEEERYREMLAVEPKTPFGQRCLAMLVPKGVRFRNQVDKKRGGHSWPPRVFLLITYYRNASVHPLRLPCLLPFSSAMLFPYIASLPVLNIGLVGKDATKSDLRRGAVFTFIIILIYTIPRPFIRDPLPCSI